MSKVLLLTLASEAQYGGIARYIGGVQATFPDHVEVVSLPDMRYQTILRTVRAAKGRYDVLWVHHVLPVGTVAWLSRILGGIPYVVFLHGMDFDLARRSVWKRFLTRRILRGAKRIVANSRALSNEVKRLLGCQEMPLVVSPAVNHDLFILAQGPMVRTERLPIMLLTVSRLVERKGHKKVLRAMQEVPNTFYTIVGDGPMCDDIVREARALGIANRVRLVGSVSAAELAHFYREADIFVMPATRSAHDREGFGTVYLEASLFALPVIAVDTPGVNEAVLRDATGILIDDTHEALVEALLRMCGDAEFRQRLGTKGRERVMRDFTCAAQYEKLRACL